ncbi:hypothetical protein J5N97_003639 [Dioscorea zingiberensis]|uniref:Uncharacterized protein n=1 Tax=Dioscorea zingiberensis TaxID=325984 RepID=A0A9D5D6Z2_9LILI|nr:hypothetical protein J5N97_003639 [Dioscorea zingiberensis]
MDVHSDMQIVEATSLEDIHLAMKQLSSAVVENPNKSIESKDGSSDVMDSQIYLEEEAVTDLDVKRADSELLGTHSELQVVEATSLEDIHLAMKQLSAGMVNDPKKSSQDADESSIAEGSQMHLEPEVVRHANAEKVNSELLVLEAKSIEDISSAFKQLHGDFFDKSVYSEAQPSEALLDRVYVEPVETHSDLQVIEAKSLEDIHLVLRQQSEVQTPAGQLESEVLELQSIQETEAASRTEHVKDSTEV